MAIFLPSPETRETLTLPDNFCFVVGDDEMRNRKVNIRYRDDTSTQARDVPVDLEDAVEKLRKLKADRGMYNPFPHKKEEEATKA